MKAWKRNAVVATVALFVCVAVYLNWQYNRTDDPLSYVGVSNGQFFGGTQDVAGGETQTVTDQASGDPASGYVASGDEESALAEHSSYFDGARLARQQARDSAVELLNTASASKETTQEAKDIASKEISRLVYEVGQTVVV
ncbi:hypothetical protein FACS1894171_2530 [Clostridia bacterium]|nr:hypothetical protein FACS1894171_2530 [Clostridia bacterium]